MHARIAGVVANTRIYVGNLPYSVGNAQLSQLFSAYGEVVEARVITDRGSGQSKGFAFIEMSSAESARRAIAELNGTTFDYRTLRVNEAGDERPAGARFGGYSGDRSPGRGGYSGRSRRDDFARGDRW